MIVMSKAFTAIYLTAFYPSCDPAVNRKFPGETKRYESQIFLHMDDPSSSRHQLFWAVLLNPLPGVVPLTIGVRLPNDARSNLWHTCTESLYLRVHGGGFRLSRTIA